MLSWVILFGDVWASWICSLVSIINFGKNLSPYYFTFFFLFIEIIAYRLIEMNDSNVIRDREEGIVPFFIFLHVFPLCYTFCNCPKVLGFLFCLSDSLTVSTSILESCIVISQGLLILSSHISTVLIISLKELLISVLLGFFYISCISHLDFS